MQARQRRHQPDAGRDCRRAIDGLQVTVDGAAATNAAVNIDGSGLGKALSANLANDAANVTLKGGSGNDTLVSGTGDDFFDGGGGGDVIAGGIGIDTVSYHPPRSPSASIWQPASVAAAPRAMP